MRKLAGVLGVVVVASQSPAYAQNCSPQIAELIDPIKSLEETAAMTAENQRKWAEVRTGHRRAVQRLLASMESLMSVSRPDRAMTLCVDSTRTRVETAKSNERWAHRTADSMQSHVDSLRIVREALQEACGMEQAALRVASSLGSGFKRYLAAPFRAHRSFEVYGLNQRRRGHDPRAVRLLAIGRRVADADFRAELGFLLSPFVPDACNEAPPRLQRSLLPHACHGRLTPKASISPGPPKRIASP